MKPAGRRRWQSVISSDIIHQQQPALAAPTHSSRHHQVLWKLFDVSLFPFLQRAAMLALQALY